MARRKNVKRIDPRYFLHETVNRDINTGEVLDEEREAPVTHWIAGPGGLVDQHGDVVVKPGTSFAATRKPGQPGMMVIGVGHGTSTERWFGERPVPYEDVQKHRSNSNYKPPQPNKTNRPEGILNETVNRGETIDEGVKDYIKSPALHSSIPFGSLTKVVMKTQNCCKLFRPRFTSESTSLCESWRATGTGCRHRPVAAKAGGVDNILDVRGLIQYAEQSGLSID